MKAVLIGSIGAICETSEIQRGCFNQALAEYDTGLYWNVAHYCEMIRTPGGLARLQNLGIDEATAQAIHERKQALFAEAIKGGVAPRAGITELISECQYQSIKLGFVTTTTPATLAGIMSALSETIDFNAFDIITDASHLGDASRAKPMADIYHHALQTLGVAAKDAIAIEDSEANAAAAQKAGLMCLLTPGEYQLDDKHRITPVSYAKCASLLQEAA